jgi:fucokinase
MLHHLVDGWNLHRLAVADPDRVAGWDDVVITASGPAQAGLYRAQLDRLRAIHRLGEATRTWVVEDPNGARIGSGGATLNACLLYTSPSPRDH